MYAYRSTQGVLLNSVIWSPILRSCTFLSGFRISSVGGNNLLPESNFFPLVPLKYLSDGTDRFEQIVQT